MFFALIYSQKYCPCLRNVPNVPIKFLWKNKNQIPCFPCTVATLSSSILLKYQQRNFSWKYGFNICLGFCKDPTSMKTWTTSGLLSVALLESQQTCIIPHLYQVSNLGSSFQDIPAGWPHFIQDDIPRISNISLDLLLCSLRFYIYSGTYKYMLNFKNCLVKGPVNFSASF